MTSLIIIGLLSGTLAAILLLAVHLGFRAPRIREQGTPGDLGLDHEAIAIPTPAGKQLFGWWLPRPAARSTLVIIHGWGGNAELMLPMALPFHRAGINVLLIDARNHGRSDSDSFSSLPRFAEDLGTAVTWLRRTRPECSRRVALLGHSVGAGAVLLTASRRHDIDAVISVSAFAHPAWAMRRFLSRRWLPTPLISLVMRYVEWVIGYRYEEIAPIHTVCRVRCPVLLVHGTRDNTVPLADARAIARGCRRPHITLLEIEGADHDSVEEIERQGHRLVAFLRQSGVLPVPDRAPGSGDAVGQQQAADDQCASQQQ